MDKDSLIGMQIDKAARIIDALSNGKRFSLIKTLLNGERIVGDLALIVGLSQSATSQHLRRLKLSAILLQKKDAQLRFCRINPDMVSILEQLISIAEQGRPSRGLNASDLHA